MARSDAETLQTQLLQEMHTGYLTHGRAALAETVARSRGMRLNARGDYVRDPNASKTSTWDGDNVNYGTPAQSIRAVAGSYENLNHDPTYQGQAGIDADLEQARGEARASTQHATATYGNAMREAEGQANLAFGGQQQQATDLNQLADSQATQANLAAASRFSRQTQDRANAGAAIGLGTGLYNAYQNRPPPRPTTQSTTGSYGLPASF